MQPALSPLQRVAHMVVLLKGGIDADRDKIARIPSLGKKPLHIADAPRHEDLGLRQRGFEELHSNHALMWAKQNVELPPQLVHAGEQFVHPHLAEGGVRVIGIVVGQVPHPGKGRDRGCLR